jgi:hypothetical protein
VEKFLAIIDGKQVEVMASNANEAVEKAKTMVRSDTTEHEE